MTTMQCSKELMNYWDKLEPTDEKMSVGSIPLCFICLNNNNVMYQNIIFKIMIRLSRLEVL